MTNEKPNDWTELSLSVAPQHAEAIAELLQDLTGNGVTIEPPIQALGPDEGYVLDNDAPLSMQAYIPGPVNDQRRSELELALRNAGGVVGEFGWQVIKELDWANAWREFYDIEHSGRIAVRPAWKDYEAKSGEIVVSLDPGMAFGTGQHATTRMCLLALQEFDVTGMRVLDLGCGSGVLGIAAMLMGAASCVATDIEEQAVAASIANSELNNVELDIREGSIDTAEDRAPYNLILANIHASALIALAPAIAALLKPGGVLITSGIIATREAEVSEAFAATGFSVDKRLEEGDWRALIGRKLGA